MKKIHLIIWPIVFCSLSTFANRPNINAGSSTTTGPSSNNYSLSSGSYNPAMGALMVKDPEHWRLGYLPTISTEIELGNVGNFSDDLDELIDIVDDPSLAKDSVDATLDRFNTVLVAMGKDGYVKNNSLVSIPLFYRSDLLGGAISVDLNYEVQVAARILNDVLSFNQQNTTFTTNTSVYLKSGLEKDFSIAYSRSILEEKAFVRSGVLYGGVRLSAVNLQLSKQVIWIEGVKNKELKDIVTDEYDQNLTSTNGFSVDAGLVWESPRYRLGLTVTNLNGASFDYNRVGQDCDQAISGSTESDNCNIATYFIETKGVLKAKEVHKKHALMSVDGLYKMTEKWRIMGSADLAKYDDVVGFENQFFMLATTYDTETWWLPSPRIGYQKNLAGTQLSSINAGLTFFSVLSLDVVYGQEKTIVDNKTVPRLAGISLGFEEKF